MQNNDQRTIIKKDKWVLIISIICLLALIFTNYGRNNEVVYDCINAHWNPNVPDEVRSECQKIMYEEWKKIQEEELKKKFITT